MCFCGQVSSFSECCEPFIKGIKQPETAEKLMRSRYAAYCTISVQYIIGSTHFSTRNQYSTESVRTWAKESNFACLQILYATGGEPDAKVGAVEFKASFTDKNNKAHIHHEKSFFIKEDGRWFFLNGIINP